MKLLSFEHASQGRRLGVCVDQQITDVEDLIRCVNIPLERLIQIESAGISPALGGLMRWLQLDSKSRNEVMQQISQRVSAGQHPSFTLGSVTLRAPLARPGKIVAVGRNYADHAKETGVFPFEKPRIIFKLPSSVADPNSVISKPPLVQKMDFEVELAVVIGDFARNVSHDDALNYVAGYTVLNDLSAREFQFDISPPQTTFAKSIDGFCPIGPWMVTDDEISNPQDLWVRTWVNDELMQEGHTADMLFSVRDLIAYNSQYMTLEPGDILATGTPAGIGAFRTPPVWLKSGDRLRMDITNIGVLENFVG
jgi:2-keto-4-pentenoate hydratase/2-oxohepta-3-ene-1,7-dioic acid hydratase in catechol pathway